MTWYTEKNGLNGEMVIDGGVRKNAIGSASVICPTVQGIIRSGRRCSTIDVLVSFCMAYRGLSVYRTLAEYLNLNLTQSVILLST